MPNVNGLIAPPAYKNPEVPYYAQAENPVIVEPTLIAPIAMQPATQNTTAYINVQGAAGPYLGAITFSTGEAGVIDAADAMTMRPTATGVAVEIGTNSQPINTLSIAGAEGLSEVYDAVYNPAVSLKALTLTDTNPLCAPTVGNTGELFRCEQAGVLASATAAIGTNFEVPVTGWYSLQIEMKLQNAPAPAATDINVPITAVGGIDIGQTLSFAIVKGVVVEPYGLQEMIAQEFAAADILVQGGNVIRQYVSQHLFEAGETYTFTLRSSSALWNIGSGGQLKAELIAMC